MRFIAIIFNGASLGLYFVYKPRTRFIFTNINLDPIRMLRRCGFQNCGLKSDRYESPLLVVSYISWFINLYALYKPANLEVLKRYHPWAFGPRVIYFQTSLLVGLYNVYVSKPCYIIYIYIYIYIYM